MLAWSLCLKKWTVDANYKGQSGMKMGLSEVTAVQQPAFFVPNLLIREKIMLLSKKTVLFGGGARA